MRHSRPVALVILFLIPVLKMGQCLTERLPLDSDLEDRFVRNEGEFNRLVQMFEKDDGILGITPDGHMYSETDPNYPIPPSRATEYRSLLKNLHVTSVHRESHQSRMLVLNVAIVGHLFGALSGGCLKGYVYSGGRALLPSVESLDPVKGKPKVYKHLKGEWYLYRECV